jgi:FMN reductase (NADPH)
MMNYDNFMEVIRTRRSVRTYKPDPISDEMISKLIEAGKWAPSGNNTQPFEIVVLKDAELMGKVSEILNRVHGSKSKQEFGAPVTLVVLGDPRLCNAYPKGPFRDEILHASLSAAIENMILASTTLGLGGIVWKTVSLTAGVLIKELLGIPQLFFLKAMLPLGYPSRDVKPPMKRDIMVHKDKYDSEKFKSDEEIDEIIREYSRFKTLNQRYIP